MRFQTRRGETSPPAVAITIDVHQSDTARTIDCCSRWLEERTLPATFFVPTALLQDDRLAPALRRLDSSIHAIGTHGHRHDERERAALRAGGEKALTFLRLSRDLYREFYDRAPQYFRAPCWCAMSATAFATLDELGYRVDCSSTPQRPGILSSYPQQNPWLFAPRDPHFVRGRLLEIPTSCFFLPLASPTFLTLRRRASVAFSKALALEAALRPRRCLTLMLHAGDFLPDWSYDPRRRFTLADLVPRRQGGLMWRALLRCRDPEKIVALTYELMGRASSAGVMTLQEIYDRSAAER